MSTLREDLEADVRLRCETRREGRTPSTWVELESLLDWLATTLTEESTHA